MKIEFLTARYVFATGHRPAGFGFWAFQIGTDKEPFFAQGRLSLTQAKEVAKAEARRRAELYFQQFGKKPYSIQVEVLP